MSGSLTPTTYPTYSPTGVTPSTDARVGSWTPPAGPPPHGTATVVRRLLAIARRYKWIMLAIVAVGTALGVAATRLLTPSYVVHATVWISNEADVEQTRGPIRASELLSTSAFVELLRSFAIVDPVVEKLALYLVPADPADSLAFQGFVLGEPFRPGEYVLNVDAAGRGYSLAAKKEGVFERGTVGDSIGRKLGFRWAPAPGVLRAKSALRFTVVTPREASIKLNERLEANLPQGSNFLRLALRGEDPIKTAAAMNVWINEFVSSAAILKKRNLVEFANILQGQLRFAERELKNAEINLERFRVNTITLPSESGPVAGGVELTRDPLLDSYFGQKLAYDNIRRDRETLEHAIGDATRGELNPNAFLAIPSVRESAQSLRDAIGELSSKQAQLRAAQQYYTDEHKTVRDLQGSVQSLQTQTIPQLARGELEQLQRREADLARRIGSATREIRNIPTRTIEEMRLRREVAVAENLYTSLQNRYEEAKLAEASAVADLSVLDQAVPPQYPSDNTAPRIILLAFLASLGLAGGLGILLDRLDQRVRYADQVTHELGLTIIGAVPTIRKIRGGVSQPEEAVQVVEAFRSIRLNLRHAYEPKAPVILTVSSPGAGDGKSLVSSNVALSFAESGFRTLLIDGDTRRGDLHTMFGVERVPGLLDFLMDDCGREEMIRPTTHEKLSLIPCGTRRHRGPELLASKAMTALVQDLGAEYEVVIVDSPPLGAGIDPFALGTATGNMLLVVRTGETDRKMAHAKLAILDRLPVRLVGAVLNDVRTSEGEYLYYSYLDGYSTVEDPAPRLTSQV